MKPTLYNLIVDKMKFFYRKMLGVLPQNVGETPLNLPQNVGHYILTNIITNNITKGITPVDNFSQVKTVSYILKYKEITSYIKNKNSNCGHLIIFKGKKYQYDN